MDIFETKNIIPEFCFGCFKVQTEVDNFFDLIRLAALFYNFKVIDDLIAKTMIELRPNIPGFYKGFIYCQNLNQAFKVKKLLDIIKGNDCDESTVSFYQSPGKSGEKYVTYCGT